MPEPITGIASLSAFILMAKWIGRPANRGVTTITLAHVTFSMVFVTTVVHSRMIEADIAIEEAALDFGDRPWQVLRDVTLPVIAPAIVAGWLLALTISLDDGVISNFVTGPGQHDPADPDLVQGQNRHDPRHQRAHHHHHADRRHRCRHRGPASAPR
jgi:putrescine transport system permease protein